MTTIGDFAILARMRVVFALLAVLALLASPSIAAAKVDCGVTVQQAANGVDMAGMDMPVAQDSAVASCCDPGSKQKHGNKGCAQICAAMNAVAMTNPPMIFSRPLPLAPIVLAMPARTHARSFEPSGLKRPPKRIA